MIRPLTPASEPVPADRLRPSRPQGWTVAASAAVILGVTYVVLRNGAWVYDDNLLLVLARRSGFTLRWIDHPIFQHWNPGMNATFSVMLHVFPLDWRWGLIVLLALLGAAMVVFERVIGLIIGRSPTSIGVTVWFGLSILWTRQLQWWTAGLQQLPMVLCELVCLYAFLRFYRERRARWIAISAIAMGVGLLFYEKPALMPVYLAVIRLLFIAEGYSFSRFATALRQERWLWLAYGAVLVVWVVGYLHSGAYGQASTGHVSIHQYLDYFRILWVNTLVPALVGVTLPASGLNAVQTAAAVACQLGLAALIVWSLKRRRAAWRGWAVLAATILVDGILVAHSRVHQFGVGVGNDLRYLTDFVWLVPLCLCLAFSPDGLRTAPRSLPSPMRTRRALGLLALAALVGYAVGSVATAAKLQREWNSTQARHWEANVTHGLGQVGSGAVVADNAVPFEVISYPFAPENRLSRVLPLYAHGVRVDGPIVGPLLTIAIDGSVHSASPVPLARSVPLGRLLRDGTLSAPHASLRHGALCASTGTAPVEIVRRFAAMPARPDPYYLEVSYTSPQTFAAPLQEDAGAGYTGVNATWLSMAKDSRRSIAWLPGGAPKRVQLGIPPHHTACVTDLRLVVLRAS